MIKKILIGVILLSTISFGYLLPRFQITGYGLTGNGAHSAGELEGIIPILYDDTSMFFTDFRGLGYINGSDEGSIAVGWRHLYKNLTIGLHGGIDIRKTGETKNYFQEGTLGGELWINSWYVGLNGYIPVGNSDKIFTTYVDEAQNNLYKTIGVTDFAEAAFSGSDLWVGYNINPKITLYGRGFYFTKTNFKAFTGGALRAEYKVYGKNQTPLLGWLNHIGIFIEGKYDTYNHVTGLGGLKINLYDPNQQKATKHFLEPIVRDMDIITVKKQTSPTVKVLAPDGTEIHIYDVHNEDELKMAKTHKDANVIALHGNFDVDKSGESADLDRDITLTGHDYIYTGSDGKSHTLKVSDGATITFSKEQPLFDVSSTVHNVVVRDLTVYNAGDIFKTSKKDDNHNNTGGDLYHTGINVDYINDQLYGTFITVFTTSNNYINIKDSTINTSSPLQFSIDGSNFQLNIDHTTFKAGGGISIDVTGYTKTTQVGVSITNSIIDLRSSNESFIKNTSSSSNSGVYIPPFINGISITAERSNLTILLDKNEFFGNENTFTSYVLIGSSAANYSTSNPAISSTLNATITNNKFHNISVNLFTDVAAGALRNTGGPTYTSNATIVFKKNILDGQTSGLPLSFYTATNQYKNESVHLNLDIEDNTIDLDVSKIANSSNSSKTGTEVSAIKIEFDNIMNSNNSFSTVIKNNKITIQKFPFVADINAANFVTITGSSLLPTNINLSNNTMLSYVTPNASNPHHVSSIAFYQDGNSTKNINLTFKGNHITVSSVQWQTGIKPWEQRINNGVGYDPILSIFSSSGQEYTINGLVGQNGLNTLDVNGSGNNTYSNLP